MAVRRSQDRMPAVTTDGSGTYLSGFSSVIKQVLYYLAERYALPGFRSHLVRDRAQAAEAFPGNEDRTA